MPAEHMRDANTLFATTTQLAAGLAIAVATVALRLGGLLGDGKTAYTVAFCLLAAIALIAAAEALWLRPEAGAAVRAAKPRATSAGERA